MRIRKRILIAVGSVAIAFGATTLAVAVPGSMACALAEAGAQGVCQRFERIRNGESFNESFAR